MSFPLIRDVTCGQPKCRRDRFKAAAEAALLPISRGLYWRRTEYFAECVERSAHNWMGSNDFIPSRLDISGAWHKILGIRPSDPPVFGTITTL